MLLLTNQGFAETLQVIHVKMTCTFSTDDVRVKVPSYQKFTQFLQYKIFHKDIIRLNFGLFGDIPDCRNIRRIRFKSFASIGIFVSSTQYHGDQHYQQLDHKKSALSLQFAYKFCTVLYALLSVTQH